MKQLLGRSSSGLFATRTLTGHLIRGAVAFALLYLAIGQQHLHPVASLGAGLLALVAMRGCPMCWTIGLVETTRQRFAVTRSRSVSPSARAAPTSWSHSRSWSGWWDSNRSADALTR